MVVVLRSSKDGGKESLYEKMIVVGNEKEGTRVDRTDHSQRRLVFRPHEVWSKDDGQILCGHFVLLTVSHNLEKTNFSE